MSDMYTQISQMTGVPRVDVKRVILAFCYHNNARATEQNKWVRGPIIDIKPERMQ